MSETKIHNPYETVESFVELLNRHEEIGSVEIVPARVVTNICVSPVEPQNNAGEANEFMDRFVPTKEELNGQGESLRVDPFEQTDDILRLGRFALGNVLLNGAVNGRRLKGEVLVGDTVGLHNVFGQSNRQRSLPAPGKKSMIVRFFPATSHMEHALNTGENKTSIPLLQLSEKAAHDQTEKRIEAIESGMTRSVRLG